MHMAFVPVVVAAAAAALAFADRRLKTAAQPLRLQLADKGEEFLQVRNVPEELRDHVRFLLDHAFGMRVFLMTAFLAIPFIAVVFLVHPEPLQRSALLAKQMESGARSAFSEICRLHDRITLANHWILLPLVEIQIVLFMPLAIVLRAVFWGRVPETGGRESVLSYIENKQSHLMLWHAHASASGR
jgi:hypothetical protein